MTTEHDRLASITAALDDRHAEGWGGEKPKPGLIAEARALIAPLTGHTPGPWRVDPAANCDVQSCRGETLEVASTHPALLDGGNTPPGTIPQKNARLIAAAPEMRDQIDALADHADALTQRVAVLTETAAEAARQHLLDLDLRNAGVAEHVAAAVRAALQAGDAQ